MTSMAARKENGPPPTADEAKQNMKRMAKEKGLATKAAKKAEAEAAAAAAAAAGTGRPERAASKGVAAAVDAAKSSQQRATEAAGATGGIN